MSMSWDPLNKGSNIVLSNGNLTATKNTSGYNSVRTADSFSSGKWYWEITFDNAGMFQLENFGVGQDNPSALNWVFTYYLTGYAYREDGYKRNNNTGGAFGSTFTTGDIISIAFDADNGKVWFAKNGVWQASGDPVGGLNEAYSGITGTNYAWLTLHDDTTSVTANFGASTFSYTVPSGFSGVDECSSGTYYPIVTADDGFTHSITLNFLTSYLRFGHVNDESHNLFVRFPNVNIPQGAVITTAKVTFTALYARTDIDCNANIYFNDEDNAIAPITVIEYDAKSVTSVVDWSGVASQPSVGGKYDTPDIKVALQDVIDRAGWSSGNAVMLLIKDNGSDTNVFRDETQVGNTAGYETELYVEWSLPVDNSETVNYDAKIIIIKTATNNLDGKSNIKDTTDALLDGKVDLTSKKYEYLDGNLEINVILENLNESLYWNNGVPVMTFIDPNILNLTHWKDVEAFGDLVYRKDFKNSRVSLVNGRVHLKDSEIYILDGKIIVKEPIEIDYLLDGKIEIKTIPVGLVKILIS